MIARSAPLAGGAEIRAGRATWFLLALTLAGCAGPPDVDLRRVPVDQMATAGQIAQDRRQAGLGALTPDARLVAIAQATADAMARRDASRPLSHSAAGLARRLDRAGYVHVAAAENLGSGYRDLEALFAGWRGSPGHAKNLKNPYMTRFGLARTDRADGTWRHFWVLILARPLSD